MINKKNIIAFIQYLYLKKNNTDAPPQLLEKWAAVPEIEINTQLQNLFEHWQYTPTQQQQCRQEFIAKVNASKTVYPTSPEPIVPRKQKRNYTGLIFLAIFLPIVLIAYQYFLFNNLQYVYAITNNVSIRNDSSAIVARLDLQAPNKIDLPSFDKVIAMDNDVYDRTIDSTGKLKKYRKIVIGQPGFINFLLNNKMNIAYVNANYVTESKQEFEQYKTVFGQLSAEEANMLELKFRKIIIGSLGFASDDLQGKYIMNACASTNKEIHKKFTCILKQTIIENTRYAVIARLSDGYYYRFYGDLAENSFAKPVRIGYVQKPSSDDEYLMGDLLFRYLPATKQYGLYDCNGKSLHYFSEVDNQNRVWYFLQKIEPEPISNFIQDIIDTIKNSLPKLDL
jgi:hypothetical protein